MAATDRPNAWALGGAAVDRPGRARRLRLRLLRHLREVEGCEPAIAPAAAVSPGRFSVDAAELADR